MKQVVGYYFQLRYPKIQVECLEKVIECNRVQINNNFSGFIKNIWFHTDILDTFRFAQSNKFKSLKKIRFFWILFTNEIIEQIKKILNKVDNIKIIDCPIKNNFYQEFLQFLLIKKTVLKRLHILWATNECLITSSRQFKTIVHKLCSDRFKHGCCYACTHESETGLFQVIHVNLSTLELNSYLEMNKNRSI